MRQFQHLFLVTGAFIFFASCGGNHLQSKQGLCTEQYFYYGGKSRIYFKHSLSEIWIAFRQDKMTSKAADSILQKYPFVTFTALPNSDNNYSSVQVLLKEKADCVELKNYLKILNADSEIFSATPIFYLSDNDPNSYMILLSEVLTKNDENVISESDFINLATAKNLELIKIADSYQFF